MYVFCFAVSKHLSRSEKLTVDGLVFVSLSKQYQNPFITYQARLQVYQMLLQVYQARLQVYQARLQVYQTRLQLI